MTQVSFNKFRKALYHKIVDYNWTNKEKNIDKKFHSDKFYCNPDKDTLVMPHFLSDKTTSKFYQLSDKEFKLENAHGEILLVIKS